MNIDVTFMATFKSLHYYTLVFDARNKDNSRRRAKSSSYRIVVFHQVCYPANNNFSFFSAHIIPQADESYTLLFNNQIHIFISKSLFHIKNVDMLVL